jgi:hypothetical protein
VNLERLMQADFSALADRGAQEARKWLERSRLVKWGTPPSSARDAEIERALAALQAAPAGRFFDGVAKRSPHETAAALAQAFPERSAETAAGAARCLAGEFDLLGYKRLSFGTPVDWHYDPVNGRRSPREHWSTIPTLDLEQVGDSKVIWELSRCQWWVTLACAWAATGDAKLLAAIEESVRSWHAENPSASGINWASSLEASLRLISWTWTLYLTRAGPGGKGGLSASAQRALLEGIHEHASHVEHYLSSHYSPNTHLTGEALGLFYAGTAFPELSEAARWQEVGAKILIDQLRTQVLPDGVYFEQASCYQRYTCEIYLHFMMLAGASGFTLPPLVGESVIKLLDFLVHTRRPDGSMPSIGDADGGWIMPLAARGPSEMQGIFSTAAALFRRPDYAWVAGALQPETLWLLGEEGAAAFAALSPAPPDRPATRLFPDGGYAVMSSGWDARAHQLIFDCGPMGCHVSGGHGHADLLSIQCTIFGEPVVVDPGTFVYADPFWRHHLRGTHAHSTVAVDGEPQAETQGLFGWKQHPRAAISRWTPNAPIAIADAAHEAYARLPEPISHRRRVLWVNGRFWILIDDLTNTGTAASAAEHEFAIRFQLAPMQVAREQSAGREWLRARTPGGHALLFTSFAPGVTATVREGELTPPRGWISTDYGQRTPAPQLEYAGKARLPLRVVTVLFPVESADAEAPQVSAIPSRAGPSGLVFDGRTVDFGA